MFALPNISGRFDVYPHAMDGLIKLGRIAGTIGGAAWTIKSLIIIAIDGKFQPFEGILFFLGIAGILLGALGLGAFIAQRATGAARWIYFVVTLVVAIVVTSLASSFIQNAVGDSYTGTNLGIEEEMGILTPGVIWLAVGLYLLMATRSARADAEEPLAPA